MKSSVFSLIAVFIVAFFLYYKLGYIEKESQISSESAVPVSYTKKTNPFSLIETAKGENDETEDASGQSEIPIAHEINTLNKEELKNTYDFFDTESSRFDDELTPAADAHNPKIISDTAIQAAKEQRWEGFVELADEAKLPSRDYPDLLDPLTIAIENSAPYWVFEKLVSQGYRFTTDHTLLIAANNRNDLMYGFRLLGIDVHATAPDGTNAVYATIENFQALDTFTFAIHLDVNPQKTVNGLDTLDYALTEAVENYNEDTCWFVHILILYGEVKLDNNHYELLRNLEKKNNDMFECIMRSVGHVIAYTY